MNFCMEEFPSPIAVERFIKQGHQVERTSST